jgi:hypothetical protein
MGDRVRSHLLYWKSYSRLGIVPSLSERQKEAVDALREDGYVIFPGYVPKDTLAAMQKELQQALEGLCFKTPTLAQTRIDPVRHKELIDNFMYGTPAQLKEWGVLFDRGEAKSYDQVLRDFNPSTLTVPMLALSENYRQLWLDPFILGIVSHYLGMVPSLAEAYVRRNFPAPHRTMNHHWHRDLNSIHLVKGFVFLSDCKMENGPHEYVTATHRRYDIFNGKRYFTEEEVDATFPPGNEARKTSIVPAGTVVLEDTRGLHRAILPTAGWRDLGFMVFMPLRPFYPHHNFDFPRDAYERLSPLQQAFVHPTMLS